MTQPVDPRPQIEEQIQKCLYTLDAPEASLEARHRAAAAILADCVWDKEKGLLTIVYENCPRN